VVAAAVAETEATLAVGWAAVELEAGEEAAGCSRQEELVAKEGAEASEGSKVEGRVKEAAG